MRATIYLNGSFRPEEEAGIAPLDSGFLFGEGVFETLRADRGRPFRLTAHLERLRRGLQLLGLPEPAALPETGAILERLLQENRLREEPAAIKLTVSGGPPNDAPEPTFMVRAAPLDLTAIARRRAGLRAGLIPWHRDRANPLLAIKSLNYLENRLALRWARERGLDEGIFVNFEGELCEGTFSNLFLIREETLLTPPQNAGLLAGITRQFILETAPGLGLEVREVPLRESDIETADGAFLTSSLMDLAPLLELAGKGFAPERTRNQRNRLEEAFSEARGQLHQPLLAGE